MFEMTPTGQQEAEVDFIIIIIIIIIKSERHDNVIV